MAPMTDAHGTPESHSEKDHAPDGHDTAAGHDDGAHGHDEHGHGGMSLGPIDWKMWGAGIVGVVFAVIVTAAFLASAGALGDPWPTLGALAWVGLGVVGLVQLLLVVRRRLV